MKVKDIISKCRLRDTKITILDCGDVIKETTAVEAKEEMDFMQRTLTTWEIKDDRFIIWVKPVK